MRFDIYLEQKHKLVNEFLKNYLATKKSKSSSPKVLCRAMGYSLMAGGKRLRPILAIASFETAGGKSKNILPIAASLELIHTYSLIHDDLPAMDNDDFRRNKPTNHRVFGEAIAILAGDALLTDSFELIVKTPESPDILISVIKELTLACGTEGMVGGQSADIIYEDKKIKEKDLIYIHTHKTGALIKASVRIGAIMARATPDVLNPLSRYGEKIGLAFQIIDDILDITGTKKELGKSTGSDITRGKNTYPHIYGLEESKKKAQDLINESINVLKRFGKEADPLREIARYILKRRS
jgi:geranylgeranyl diphosphate synthase type II